MAKPQENYDCPTSALLSGCRSVRPDLEGPLLQHSHNKQCRAVNPVSTSHVSAIQ